MLQVPTGQDLEAYEVGLVSTPVLWSQVGRGRTEWGVRGFREGLRRHEPLGDSDRQARFCPWCFKCTACFLLTGVQGSLLGPA